MSLKITAISHSLLKKYPVDSTKLKEGEVHPFPRGRTYEVKKWSKAENNHIKVELAHGAGTWYFFDPHVYFPPTDDRPVVAPKTSRSKTLTEEDYTKAASLLNCSKAAVRALVKIEANGRGFLKDGRPKILFEPHWFGYYTQYRYNRSLPQLSSRSWNRRLYRQGGTQWQKLERAMRLDEASAIKSASYGLFQVMGFHYKTCGYGNPKQYYDAQFTSEFEHLRCAIAFIKSKNLDRHLRSLNWAAFAYGYNGSGYRANRYDTKLAAAYRSYA